LVGDLVDEMLSGVETWDIEEREKIERGEGEKQRKRDRRGMCERKLLIGLSVRRGVSMRLRMRLGGGGVDVGVSKVAERGRINVRGGTG
jgi:hypothetical protein